MWSFTEEKSIILSLKNVRKNFGEGENQVHQNKASALSVSRHSRHQMQIKPTGQNPYSEGADCKSLVLSSAIHGP